MTGTAHNFEIRQPRMLSSGSWWAAGGAVVGAWIFSLALFADTVQTMVEVWSQSRTFAHGFFVVPATAYLIWSYRNRLTVLEPMPCRGGLLALGAAGVLWLLGQQANVLVAMQCAVVLMLPALVMTVMGTDVLRLLAMPLGFLIFAVPVGEALVPHLQDVTVAILVAGLELSGLPIYVEDRVISIPTGNWEVAEACSGLRYLISAIALGYMYSVLIYQRWNRRLLFIAATALVMIAANGARAYGLIMLGHYGISTGVTHTRFGHIVFGAAICLLFYVGLRWRERPWPAHVSRAPSAREQRVAQVTRRWSFEPLVLGAGGVLILASARLCAWVAHMLPM